MKLAFRQVDIINIRDLQLTTCRWFQIGYNIDYLFVVEIHTRDGKMGLWLFGFFHNTYCSSILPKFDHAISFGITHGIGENHCPLGETRR